MSGLFGISGNSGSKGNIIGDLFWGTFYQQHLGEEFAGISIIDKDGEFLTRVEKGHFRPAFIKEKEIWRRKVITGVGYCGPSPEPFYVETGKGDISICFTGNISNAQQLKNEFKKEGRSFVRGDEIELISKIIAQGETFTEGLQELRNRAFGAYSVILISREGLYACSDGRWPLVVGKKDGEAVVATGSAGFANLGIKLTRNVRGEIVVLKNGDIEDIFPLENSSPVCSFMWVYTGFPADRFRGVSASEIRKELGAKLARRDVDNGFIPDIVVPVPDSGRFHAIGYHQAFIRLANEGKISRVPVYDEVLLKYPYAGRSFTPPSREIRELEASIKQVPSGEDYRGVKAVVVDDSIVRGTQTQNNLVPKLRAVGLQGIHLRVGNPELRTHCPWGKSTKKGETLADMIPDIEKRRKYLGVDSLVYNTIQDLEDVFQILGREELCMDCSKGGI